MSFFAPVRERRTQEKTSDCLFYMGLLRLPASRAAWLVARWLETSRIHLLHLCFFPVSTAMSRLSPSLPVCRPLLRLRRRLSLHCGSLFFVEVEAGCHVTQLIRLPTVLTTYRRLLLLLLGPLLLRSRRPASVSHSHTLQLNQSETGRVGGCAYSQSSA